MSKVSSAERDRQALALRKRGVGPVAIARRLGFTARPATKTLPARSAAEVAEAAVGRALAEDMPLTSAYSWRDLEFARASDMLADLHLRKGKGEKVDREILKVQEVMLRLSQPATQVGEMSRAVSESLAAIDVRAEDAAVAMLARSTAAMIDQCVAMGTVEDSRRALNMSATLRNLLADLGATPASRQALLSRSPELAGADGAEKHDGLDRDQAFQDLLGWTFSGADKS